MSFNLFTFPISDSIAVRQGQTCQHGSFVSFNAAHEALKFSDVTVPCRSELIVKTFSLPMTKYVHKLLDQLIHHVGRRTRLTNESEVLCSLSLTFDGSGTLPRCS
jgi:hypothetical protein